MSSENMDTNHDIGSKDSAIQAQSTRMTKAACRNHMEKSMLILILRPEAQFWPYCRLRKLCRKFTHLIKLKATCRFSAWPDAILYDMQVRMADQAMYHQGRQSVLVGGRLWALLPPPANNRSFTSFHMVHTHTHTHHWSGDFLTEARPAQRRATHVRRRINGGNP